MIVLEITRTGSDRLELFSSDKRIVTLGRHSGNDVAIDDDSVSRYHAEIEQRQDRVYLRDLDSRNGVFVNLSPVLETPLSDGDEIRIGTARMVFRSEDVESERDRNITRVVCYHPREGSPSRPVTSRPEDTLEILPPGRMVESLIAALETKGPKKGREQTLQDQAIVAVQMAERIASASDLDTLLGDILKVLAPRVRFSRGVILLHDPKTGSLDPRAFYDGPLGNSHPGEIPVSMTIVNECLETGRGICCLDPLGDPRFACSDSVSDLRFRSVICVPILGTDEPLGMIQVDSESDDEGVRESGLPIVAVAANLLASHLETRRSQEKRREHERRGDQARVLAAASHALHSAFLLTEGQTKLLQEAATTGNADLLKSVVDQFLKSLQSTTRLVEGLHEYLRGRVRTSEPVQLNDVLAGMIDELTPALEERDIEVHFDPEESLPIGRFDPAAIRLICLNLMINAMEAMENSKKKELRIATEICEDSDICIRFEDTGCGIDKGLRDRVFDPFLTTKGKPHVGLGLTYVDHIAQGHGGHVDLESESGSGTRVCVTLPLEPDASNDGEPSRPSSPFASWLIEE